MKKNIKTFTINGNNYDIVKKGVSTALELKSIFMKIIINSGMPIDEDLTNFQYIQAQMAGVHGEVVTMLKHMIMSVVAAPELDSDVYEDLDASTVMEIFNTAYDFYFGVAEDKKKEQTTSSEEVARVTTLKI